VNTDVYGHTPLHRAVSKASLKLLELLIVDYKANVNAMDKEGNTPL
jgi:ankyrin repeat protein